MSRPRPVEPRQPPPTQPPPSRQPSPVGPKPAGPQPSRPPTRAADCPDALRGRHGLADVHGHCPYCGQKVERAKPLPQTPLEPAEPETSYRYFYDPDFGSGATDVYA